MQLSHLTIYCMCVLSNICRCGCMQEGETEESNVGNCIITRVCVVADFGATAECAEEIHTAGNVSFITLQLSSKNCFLFWLQSHHVIGWFINKPLLQWIAKCWNKKLCSVRIRDDSKHVQVGVLIEVEGSTASTLPAACSITVVPKIGSFSRQSRNSSDLDCSLDKSDIHHSSSPDYDTGTVQWVLPSAFYNRFRKQSMWKKSRKKRSGFPYPERNRAFSGFADDIVDDPVPKHFASRGDLKDIFFSDYGDSSDIYTGELMPDEKIWDADLPESVDPVMTFPDDALSKINNDDDDDIPAFSPYRHKLPRKTAHKTVNMQQKKLGSVANLTQESKRYSTGTEGKDMLSALEESIEGRLQSSLQDLMQDREDRHRQDMSLVSTLAMENKVNEALASVEKEPKLRGPALETLRGATGPAPAPPLPPISFPGKQDATPLPLHPIVANLIPPSEHVISSVNKPRIPPPPPPIPEKKMTTASAIANTTTTTPAATTVPTALTDQLPPSTNKSALTQAGIGAGNESTIPVPNQLNLTLLTNNSVDIKMEKEPVSPSHNATTEEAVTFQGTTRENILQAELIFRMSFNKLVKDMQRMMKVRLHPERRKLLEHLETSLQGSTHNTAWAMVRQVCQEPLRRMQDVGPGWYPWSEWSSCSVSCGTSGFHIRRRLCMQDESCYGANFDLKPCHVQLKCQGSAAWLDWSRWGECSTSCGGQGGQQVRSRSCLTDDAGVQCVGDSFELMACFSGPCEGSHQEGMNQVPEPAVGAEHIKTTNDTTSTITTTPTTTTTSNPGNATSKPPATMNAPSLTSHHRGWHQKLRNRKGKKKKGKWKKQRQKKKKKKEKQKKRKQLRRKWLHSRSADELQDIIDIDSPMKEMQGLDDFNAEKRQHQTEKAYGPSDMGLEQFRSLDIGMNKVMTTPRNSLSLLKAGRAQPIPAEIAREHISWTAWGLWSLCTVTCGKGMQFRKRQCMKRIGDTFEGEQQMENLCPGTEKDKKFCSEGICPLSVAIPRNVLGIQMGGNASVTCQHNFKGEVAGVYWVTPDGSHITSEMQSDKYLMHNMTLTIRHAHQSDLGQYLCVLIGPNQLLALPEKSHFESKKRKDTCSDKPCENGGICEAVSNVYMDIQFHYRCICLSGFYGHHCEQKFLMQSSSPYLRILGYILLGVMAFLTVVCSIICIYFRIESRRHEVGAEYPIMTRRRSEDQWRKMKTYDQKGSGSGRPQKKKFSVSNLKKSLSQMFHVRTSEESVEAKHKFGMEGLEDPLSSTATALAGAEGTDTKPDEKNQLSQKSLVNPGQTMTEIQEEEFARFNDERLTANLDQPSQLERDVKQLLEDASHNASPPPPPDGARQRAGNCQDSDSRHLTSDSPPPTLQVNSTLIYSDDQMEFVTHDDSSYRLRSMEENRASQNRSGGRKLSSSNQQASAECEAKTKTSSQRTKRKRRSKEESGSRTHADKCQFNQNYSDDSNDEASSTEQFAETYTIKMFSGCQRGPLGSQAPSPEIGRHHRSHQMHSSTGEESGIPCQKESGWGTGAQGKMRNGTSHQLTSSGSRINLSVQAMQPYSENTHSSECQWWRGHDPATKQSMSSSLFGTSKHDDNFYSLFKHYEVHHPDEPYPYRLSRSRRNIAEVRRDISSSTSGSASSYLAEQPGSSDDRNLRRSRKPDMAVATTSTESAQGAMPSVQGRHRQQRPCPPANTSSMQQKYLEGGGEGAAAAEAATRSDPQKSARDVLLRRALENCFIQATKTQDSRPSLLPNVGSHDQSASSRQNFPLLCGQLQLKRSSATSGSNNPPSLAPAGKVKQAVQQFFNPAWNTSRESNEVWPKENMIAQQQMTNSTSHAKPWSKPFGSPSFSKHDSIKSDSSSASASDFNFPKSAPQPLPTKSGMQSLHGHNKVSSLGQVTLTRETPPRRQLPAVKSATGESKKSLTLPRQQVPSPRKSHTNLVGSPCTTGRISSTPDSASHRSCQDGFAKRQDLKRGQTSHKSNSTSAQSTHLESAPDRSWNDPAGSREDNSQFDLSNKANAGLPLAGNERQDTNGEGSSFASKPHSNSHHPYFYSQPSPQLKPVGLKSALKQQTSTQSLGNSREVERVRVPRRVSFSEPQVHHEAHSEREDFSLFINASATVRSEEDSGGTTTSKQFDAISQREWGPLSVEKQFDSIGRRPFGPLDLDAFFSTLPKAAPSASTKLLERDTSEKSNSEATGDDTEGKNSLQKSASLTGYVKQARFPHSSLPMGAATLQNYREAVSEKMGSALTKNSSTFSGAKLAQSTHLPAQNSESSTPMMNSTEPLLIDIENSCGDVSSKCSVQKTREELLSQQILRQNLHTQLTPDPAKDKDNVHRPQEQRDEMIPSPSEPSLQQSDHTTSSFLTAESDDVATIVSADSCLRKKTTAEEAYGHNIPASSTASRPYTASVMPVPVPFDSFQNLLALRAPSAFFKPILKNSSKSPKSASSSSESQ